MKRYSQNRNYDVFQARYTTAGQAITGGTTFPTPTVVNFNSADLCNCGFEYDSGVITITNGLSGRTAIFNVQINVLDGTGRTDLRIAIEKDTGGGWQTLVRADNYALRDTDQENGGCWINGFLEKLEDGVKYRVTQTADWDSGTPKYDPEGCFFSIIAY